MCLLYKAKCTFLDIDLKAIVVWCFVWWYPCSFYKSATGVYLAALPTPGGIQIAGKTPNDGSYEQHISHMQKRINDTIAKNKELYEITPPVSDSGLPSEGTGRWLQGGTWRVSSSGHGHSSPLYCHCLNVSFLMRPPLFQYTQGRSPFRSYFLTCACVCICVCVCVCVCVCMCACVHMFDLWDITHPEIFFSCSLQPVEKSSITAMFLVLERTL